MEHGSSPRCNSNQWTFERLESRVLFDGAPVEDLGWVSVIVDNTIASSIATNLSVFAKDQLGAGATHVSLHTDAPRMDDEKYVWQNAVPAHAITLAADEGNFLDQYKSDLATVKSMIAADATAAIMAGSHLAQVIIVGHVTTPYTGLRAYDNHPCDLRAMPTDLYFADLDGTPETWGDYHLDSDYGGNVVHELTTNEPLDGRFDADSVPSDAQAVTVSGTDGTFTLTVSGATTNPPLAYNASAQTIRTALNSLTPILSSGKFVTVVKTGNVYTIRFFKRSIGGEPPTITAAGSGGATTLVQKLSTGGIEVSIGRIDMANLDAAFPEQSEADLLNQYLERNHVWRFGLRQPTLLNGQPQAILDPIGETEGGGVDADLKLLVGDNNVTYDTPWLDAFAQTTPTRYLFASVYLPR